METIPNTPQSQFRVRIEQFIKDEREKEIGARGMGWENQERFHNIRRQAFQEVLNLLGTIRTS